MLFNVRMKFLTYYFRSRLNPCRRRYVPVAVGSRLGKETFGSRSPGSGAPVDLRLSLDLYSSAMNHELAIVAPFE